MISVNFDGLCKSKKLQKDKERDEVKYTIVEKIALQLNI